MIQLYLAWDKDFLVLLDGDKAGERAKDEYIKLFGVLIKKRVKMYHEFVPTIGNHMMEDIFSEEEKLMITQRFDDTATQFNKSAFNTAIQRALINQDILSVSKETIDKFDLLLEALNNYNFE